MRVRRRRSRHRLKSRQKSRNAASAEQVRSKSPPPADERQLRLDFDLAARWAGTSSAAASAGTRRARTCPSGRRTASAAGPYRRGRRSRRRGTAGPRARVQRLVRKWATTMHYLDAVAQGAGVQAAPVVARHRDDARAVAASLRIINFEPPAVLFADACLVGCNSSHTPVVALARLHRVGEGRRRRRRLHVGRAAGRRDDVRHS